MKENLETRNFCCQGLFFRADAHHVRHSLCIEDASQKVRIGARGGTGREGPFRAVWRSFWVRVVVWTILGAPGLK